MLREHFRAVEEHLLAVSRIPANAGHTLHRGTPREAFIREFLSKHLSERVAIGTGEIIDATSEARQQRNQFDVVAFKRDYPRLDLGGGVNAFLVESVVATIEVKSVLDAAGVAQAALAAAKSKGLQRHLTTTFMAGYQPPALLNYIVAYDGPASMATVNDWLKEVHAANQIEVPELSGAIDRYRVPAPSIDGIFVLGRGFLYFDNVPMGLASDDTRAKFPKLRWVYSDSAVDNLLLLFLFLTTATSNMSGSWLDAGPYVQNLRFENVRWSA